MTGIAKLGLKVDIDKPFNSFIYVAAYDDIDFALHFGVAKGLIIVCGEEKVVTNDQSPIEYHSYGLPSDTNEIGVLQTMFSVDI